MKIKKSDIEGKNQIHSLILYLNDDTKLHCIYARSSNKVSLNKFVIDENGLIAFIYDEESIINASIKLRGHVEPLELVTTLN